MPPPPPLSADEAKRLADVERAIQEERTWRKNHDGEHARLREDLTLKVADMNDAAIRHVERTIADGLKPVSQVKDELVVIKAQNVAQMTVLEQQNSTLETTRDELVLNRLEREKRSGAEEARAKLEAELKAAGEKAAKDAKDDRDAALAAKAENTKRLALYIGIITALIAGVATLAVAALSLHH